MLGARTGSRATSPSIGGIALALFGLTHAARAQELAFRHYDIADGLAHSRVACIHADRKGYVWFGTWEGLSRFDGLRFSTWSSADGLENPLVNAIAEDARGRVWVATHGAGIARFLDDPAEARELAARGRIASETSAFLHCLPSATREGRHVSAIAFDRDGRLWCGSEDGLFSARDPDANPPTFEPADLELRGDWRQGTLDGVALWFSCADRAVEIRDGRAIVHPPPADVGGVKIYALRPLDRERVIVVFKTAIYELTVGAGEPTWRRIDFTPVDGEIPRAFEIDAHGTQWIATTRCLARLRGGETQRITTTQGLHEDNLTALALDGEENLWVGTWSGGAIRLIDRGIESWTSVEGVALRNVMRLVEDPDGRIVASTDGAGIVEVEAGSARLIPRSREAPFRNVHMRLFRDSRGDWWVGTDEGAFRFEERRLALEHGRRWTAADGADEAIVFATFDEDRAGRIWFSSLDGNLYVFDPARGEAPYFARLVFDPKLGLGAPRVVRNDPSGAVWLAPFVGLGRWRAGAVESRQGARMPAEAASLSSQGTLELIGPRPGLTDPQTRDLYFDQRGWLWIATRFRGVSMTREPAAEDPKFVAYTTREGLASDAGWTIAGDANGTIWIGTARGIDALEPQSGALHHLSTSDGLAGDVVNHLLFDRAGFLWAATAGGISRIAPGRSRIRRPTPRVWLTRVQFAGEDLPVARSGVERLDAGELDPDRRSLLVEFTAPCFADARDLRFQYELAGAGGGWSEPRSERSVHYAGLAPGAYRFRVRAVGRDGELEGTPQARPAELAFTILPPLWQRTWFLALAALALAGTAFAWHRARVRRLLGLESIRRQIATDLHDDLGSGLAQIAILTEVAKRESSAGARARLDEVAGLARSLRDSMSDIVWAIDPRQDRFGDLVRRMRQVAFNLLEAEGLQVEFEAPSGPEIDALAIAPDRRRHLLLIVKEALANVARHARATHVRIVVSIEGARLWVVIQDDGVGFDPERVARGQGLDSLRRRAQALRADLDLRAEPGAGTRVEVRVPLARARSAGK